MRKCLKGDVSYAFRSKENGVNGQLVGGGSATDGVHIGDARNQKGNRQEMARMGLDERYR